MSETVSFEEIKEKALELGWDDVGVTSATIPEEDISAYEEWIENGYFADLEYMKKKIRCYPEQLLPGAKSAIIFVSYYKQEKQPFQKGLGVIASYARGRKYHNVHHSRLKKFIHWFESRTGHSAKGFSDSTPILEKALAVQAGLGWFGKNTLLIHKKFGTFTLLSGLLTTLEFSFSVQNARLPRCGSCTRCLDACPTGAFVAPFQLNASKCLSNHTIESKKPIPDEIASKNPGYIFGCDICQDVCPHNARKEVSQTLDFSPKSGIGPYLSLIDLQEMAHSPEKLHGTPLQRRGITGLFNTFHSILK